MSKARPILRIRSPIVGREESVFEIGAPRITIGRGEDCDVVLLEQAASRVHAEIRATPSGYVVFDAGSHNGVWVGGERVQQHPLRDGASFRIGGSTLQLVLNPHAQPTFVHDPTIGVDTSSPTAAPADAGTDEASVEPPSSVPTLGPGGSGSAPVSEPSQPAAGLPPPPPPPPMPTPQAPVVSPVSSRSSPARRPAAPQWRAATPEPPPSADPPAVESPLPPSSSAQPPPAQPWIAAPPEEPSQPAPSLPGPPQPFAPPEPVPTPGAEPVAQPSEGQPWQPTPGPVAPAWQPAADPIVAPPTPRPPQQSPPDAGRPPSFDFGGAPQRPPSDPYVMSERPRPSGGSFVWTPPQHAASAPSFFGALADIPDDMRPVEDEPPPRPGPWIALLLVIVMVVALIIAYALGWRFEDLVSG